MPYLIMLAIALASFINSFSQGAVSSKVLTNQQVNQLFTDSLRRVLHLDLPITRVYHNRDRQGEYYVVLMESSNEVTDEKDTLHHTIKAFLLKKQKAGLVKVGELTDGILKNGEETSIWFWTKYMEFKDHTRDGLADAIIVYGSSALNGLEDGRIKFMIYYKGQKIAIRHQNGVLDDERETMVDKAFYRLPTALQAAVKQKMEQMIKSGEAIFPAGWQKAMKNKRSFFSER